MSDENAEKAWQEYIGEWDGRVDPPHAFMAGRASRDAEVAELREQLAERDAVIEQAKAWVEDPTDHVHENSVIDYARLCDVLTAPPSTLDALIREKQAEALEEAADAIRHKQHAESVRQMLNKRAAKYRNGADHE